MVDTIAPKCSSAMWRSKPRFRPILWTISYELLRNSEQTRNFAFASADGPTAPENQGVGAVDGVLMKGAKRQMLQITASFIEADGPKDPTRGVGAWAGATPVWAALGRPDLLAALSPLGGRSRPRCSVVSSRVNTRRKG